MRLVFVHWVYEDRGSAQDLYNYAQVARTLGHQVVIYGPPDAGAFDYSLTLDGSDAVIFICEWTTALQHGDRLDWLRLLGRVPRARRVVIDCDGKYNDVVDVGGDYNHATAVESQAWVDLCDSLSDKILQATLHPRRPNVRSFLFHAYNPAWERPLNPGGKRFGMFYVGNNWFRWRQLRRVLEAVEPVREAIGSIGLVGYGWDSPPPWANPTLKESAYESDPDYLRQLGVDVHPPIRFDRVIDAMGQGLFMPVIYRPLFDDLELVTCRTFETVAANTIPLFWMAPGFVEDIYGVTGRELVVLSEGAPDKLRDVLRRPDYYAGVVAELREHLTTHHSYTARLQQLLDIVES
jgi:glycosyl transferase family 1